MGKLITRDTLEVVASLDGKDRPIPPLDEKVKTASDDRMSRIFKSAQRKAGVVPNSEERDKQISDKKEGGDAKEKEPETSPKPTEPPKPKEPEKKEEASKDKGTDWESESRKHQSRADTAESRLVKLEPEVEKYKKEVETLGTYKQQVEDFTKNPVEYVMKNLPQLAQQLAGASNPITMIEKESSEFKVELDKQFAQAFGEDWKYDQAESLLPGSPSFRYKLSMEDKISEVKDKYRKYVEGVRRQAEENQRQIEDDKKKLKEEFKLTDADLGGVDEWMKSNKISYYNVAKMVLLDKIIENRLATVIPPPATPPDIQNAGKGADASEPTKVNISKEGKSVLSRFGRTAFKNVV